MTHQAKRLVPLVLVRAVRVVKTDERLSDVIQVTQAESVVCENCVPAKSGVSPGESSEGRNNAMTKAVSNLKQATNHSRESASGESLVLRLDIIGADRRRTCLSIAYDSGRLLRRTGVMLEYAPEELFAVDLANHATALPSFAGCQHGVVFALPLVRPQAVVETHVLSHEVIHVSLAHDDEVVEALVPEALNPTLRVRVHVGASDGNLDDLRARGLQDAIEPAAREFAIAIPDEVLRALPHGPLLLKMNAEIPSLLTGLAQTRRDSM